MTAARGTKEKPAGSVWGLPVFGAGGRIRTPDLLITNQLHYQLCYTSMITHPV